MGHEIITNNGMHHPPRFTLEEICKSFFGRFDHLFVQSFMAKELRVLLTVSFFLYNRFSLFLLSRQGAGHFWNISSQQFFSELILFCLKLIKHSNNYKFQVYLEM